MFASLSYTLRFTEGKPPKDVLYRWSTAEGALIQYDPPHRLTSQKHVVGHAEVGQEAQFLIDDADVQPARVARVMDSHRAAVDGEPSERIPGGGGEVRADHLQEAVEDLSVMIPVPLPGQVAIGVPEFCEDLLRFIAESNERLLPLAFPKGPYPVQGDLS